MRPLSTCSLILGSILALAACGDDATGSGGSGSGSGGASTTSSTGTGTGTTTSSTGQGGAGGGGTGGGTTCELPAADLQLVFTFPDGEVRDSSLAEGGDADADLVGPIALLDGGGYEVTDDATGDVATFVAEGGGAFQVGEGQAVRLALRFRTRFEGGPDFLQVEVVDDSTDQLLFAALRGGYHEPLDGVRVTAEIGAETACTETDPMSGAGHSVRSALVAVAGGGEADIPSEASAEVDTEGFPLQVQNLGAVVHVTPPEGYERISVVGRVSFPED